VSEWTGITGSAAYDVAACLPRAALPGWRTSSSAAARGNALHEYCRRLSGKPSGREQFLAEVPEKWRHTASGINLDEALDGIKVKATEVAYALNVKERTCRFIGVNIDRKYDEHLAACQEPPLSKYEIPFTIDVEGEIGDVPVELDYKSGQSIGDVEEHGQRRVSAAGLMLFYDTTSCISRVAYIWDTGDIKHDGHEFTIFDAWETCDYLTAAIDALDPVRAQVANGEIPKVTPDRDKQCKYCGAFNICPYWTSLLRAALSETSPSIEEVRSEDAGRVLDQVKDKLKVLGELEDALKERAIRSPLIVDDMYEFTAGSRSGRSYFDAASARGMLAVALQKTGLSEEEVSAKIASLTKKGADSVVVSKKKRLPVVKAA
jgi:hypothetical protein